MIGNTLSSSLFILSSLHLKVCFLLCLRIIFFHTLPISSWKWCFQAHIPNVSLRKLIVNAFFHRKWQSSKVLTAEIFQSLLLWKLYPLKTTYFGVLIPFQSPSHQPHQPMCKFVCVLQIWTTKKIFWYFKKDVTTKILFMVLFNIWF